MFKLSLPKIIRILSLFAISLFITFLSQSKPSTTYAATCYSGECKSPKYACQNNTMCCTGGGCPSWVCVNSNCSFKIGTGCYGPEYCVGGYYSATCSDYEPYCTWHSGYNHWHSGYWHTHGGSRHYHSGYWHWHSGYWTGCTKYYSC